MTKDNLTLTELDFRRKELERRLMDDVTDFMERTGLKAEQLDIRFGRITVSKYMEGTHPHAYFTGITVTVTL